ncbi:MAG: beta-CASP ribonuclease aCPSF1 [Nanoarchaeota archaeon]|nr:beta-CASP ribonuclease aCPSF1 [Nanoarchaeota archaeon]
MGDILKSVVKELPKNAVSTANFEGANIVLYTEDKEFFLSGEDQIRKVVNQIKKRIELRAEQSLLMDEAKTKKMIESIIPSEAEITDVIFDTQRSIVVIESKKPGIAIGKGGEILHNLKKETFWTPQIQRSPAIRSKITEAIRQVLYANDAYRKKFLNNIGKKIYKEWNPEKREEWIRITFLGSARQVGRSCLLLQTPETKILMDVGINPAAENPGDKFPYFNVPEFNIDQLDAIILSHAHLDHSALVPYLYKMGFRGPTYMTTPTRDIVALLALDFIGVAYKQAAVPLFSIEDIKEMVRHTICLDYNEVTDIAPDVRLTFYNAGHALGSAMTHLNIGNGLHNLLYTADMKYGSTKTLEPAAISFPRLETLIIESTYGGKDNTLPSRKECEDELFAVIRKAIERKGKVLIPSLGVGRGQEEMLLIEEAMSQGLIPKVPVYVDGMVWDITAIHTAYPNFLSNNVKNKIFKDENPFSSEIFKRVGSPAERKEVVEGGPCIIVATSGMLTGGASLEYFREMADGKNNMVIFTCYQASGSLGSDVKNGLKEVRLSGENGREEVVPINMEVVPIDGLSGHSGRNQLLAFINNMNPKPKKIIINHGEQSKSLDLASSLYKMYKIETVVPRNLETLRLK